MNSYYMAAKTLNVAHNYDKHGLSLASSVLLFYKRNRISYMTKATAYN